MRVLVIEDEIVLAEGLRRGLEAEGFATDVAHTGPTGCGWRSEHPYDAIVLDLMLPGMNGYQRVRGAARRGDLDADPDAHREGRRVRRGRGARHRRRRLRDEAVLLRRARRPAARAAATRRRPSARPCWRPATCAWIPAERRAWRGDVELTLTARELGLLEYLLRRAGEVCSKTEIIDHVWDDAFEGDVNIVEVYVGHLRAKLDRPFGRARDRDGPRRGLPIGGRRWMTDFAACGSGPPSRRRPSSASRWSSRRWRWSRSSGRSLTNQVHEAAEARAQEVVELVAAGRPLPVTGRPAGGVDPGAGARASRCGRARSRATP